jgi:hypothetical protein
LQIFKTNTFFEKKRLFVFFNVETDPRLRYFPPIPLAVAFFFGVFSSFLSMPQDNFKDVA